MDPAEGTVPFQPVMSWRHSRHDMLGLIVFRSPQAWHDHWAATHELIGTADIGHPFAVVETTQIRYGPMALDLSVDAVPSK